MFEPQQKRIADKIRTYCSEHQLPQPGEITWNPIPFSGEWGITTSFFQLAALESREVKEATGKLLNVTERAQQLATDIAAFLSDEPGFVRREAVRGYLNLYYSPAEYSKSLVDTIIQQGFDFGRGDPKGERG